MKRVVLLFLIAGLIISCISEDEHKVVKTQNKYSLTIPTFLTEVKNLNEDASLQYQHAWKEFYVIVIDEAKSEYYEAIETYNLSERYSNDLQGYSNIFLDNMNPNSGAVADDVLVNDLPAKVFTMEENIEGIDIYYAVAIVEGEEDFYQVMTWTLANKKQQYYEKMNQILYSFNEL